MLQSTIAEGKSSAKDEADPIPALRHCAHVHGTQQFLYRTKQQQSNRISKQALPCREISIGRPEAGREGSTLLGLKFPYVSIPRLNNTERRHTMPKLLLH